MEKETVIAEIPKEIGCPRCDSKGSTSCVPYSNEVIKCSKCGCLYVLDHEGTEIALDVFISQTNEYMANRNAKSVVLNAFGDLKGEKLEEAKKELFERMKDRPNIMCEFPNPDTMKDVHNPSHYVGCAVEPWDYIAMHKLNFDRGSAIKYISRAGHKMEIGKTPLQKEIEDINKAIEFLKHDVEMLEMGDEIRKENV